MNGFVLLVSLALAQSPEIEVVTLSERQIQGILESFTAESLLVKTLEDSISVPIGDILTIRSTTPSKGETAQESKLVLRLVDGTRLGVRSFVTSGNAATIQHSQLGELKLSLASVSSVRLAASDSKIDHEWEQLLERTSKKDMVAIRKGDVLDHLDGVIGSLTEATLQFQLDGEDIPVKREKVFGLIYSKRESTAKKAVGQLTLSGDDRLAVRQIAWNGSTWKVRLVSGLDLEVSPEQFRSLDYGASKFTYLSDLEPRNVKYTPFYDYPGTYVWEYRRDKDFDGKTIRVGTKSYDKGLAIHSQAQLKYRLGGDYRRFQAVMGIGDEIQQGNSDVIIKADNKIVFQGVAKTNEADQNGTIRRPPPQLLDIDVTGIVELEIFVGFGDEPGLNLDKGDRVYFANARLVR